MSRVAAYFFRCAAILAGYAAASLAASAFLNLVFLSADSGTGDEPLAASLAFSIPVVALFVAYFGFIPAAALIFVSEMSGRRSLPFYAVGGGLVAAAFLGFAAWTGASDFEVADLRPMLAVVGAGATGGLFYWLAAGRRAGSWRDATSPGSSGS